MINLKNTQQFYGLDKPKKPPPKKKQNKSECSKIKECTIKKVFDCINQHKTITRKLLVKKSVVSVNSVKRAIKILLERGKIIAVFIGNSGPHKMFKYSAVKS